MIIQATRMIRFVSLQVEVRSVRYHYNESGVCTHTFTHAKLAKTGENAREPFQEVCKVCRRWNIGDESLLVLSILSRAIKEATAGGAVWPTLDFQCKRIKTDTHSNGQAFACKDTTQNANFASTNITLHETRVCSAIRWKCCKLHDYFVTADLRRRSAQDIYTYIHSETRNLGIELLWRLVKCGFSCKSKTLQQ